MIATKPVVWATFAGLTAATAIATLCVWQWVSYGHLSVEHVPSEFDSIAATSTISNIQPPAAGNLQPSRTPGVNPAKMTGNAAKVISKRIDRPQLAPAKPALMARICWRTHKLAGLDCYLVEWKAKPELMPHGRCNSCGR